MPQSISDAPEWRAVPTHPGYFVNALGQIKGPSGKVLRPMAMATGHLYVLTPRPRKPRKLFVHRAVLMAFDRLPVDDELGRHLDGDPSNNTPANLAWGSSQENSDDKLAHGRQPQGERVHSARLTAQDVEEIRRLHGTMPLRALAERFGVSHTAVRRAALGIKWRSIPNG